MTFVNEHTVLMTVLLVAWVVTFIWLLLFRKRLRMSWWFAVIISFVHVVFGVICVRIFAMFEGAGIGAMSIFGAVFFMPVGYYLGAKIFRRPMQEVFDIFAIPMVFTLLCSRVNCLISGCCYGLQIGNTSFRWPTRESEMVFYLLFLVFTVPMVRRKESDGKVYPLYMASYGIFRAINECFRFSPTTHGIIHLSHLWAFISAMLGLSIILEMKNRRKKKKKV